MVLGLGLQSLSRWRIAQPTDVEYRPCSGSEAGSAIPECDGHRCDQTPLYLLSVRGLFTYTTRH